MSQKTSTPKSKKQRIYRIMLIAIILASSYFVYNYVFCHNFHVVVPDKIYSSGQPEAYELGEWINQYKVKTVVNLRGWRTDMALTEQKICQERNIDFYTIDLSAYSDMTHDQLNDLVDLLDKLQTPVLFHCRHGVDRAGTASALAAWLLGYESYSKAKRHAYVLPGPWKYKSWNFTHISDIFTDYEKYCSQSNLLPDNTQQFRSWARNIYQPAPGTYFIDDKKRADE